MRHPGPVPGRPLRAPHAPEHGPLVVLCGPMGAGKTAMGTALARRWGVDLRDSDAEVVARAGMPIPEIFATKGEDAFRELERAAVVDALITHRGVLALGGGAVLHPATREALAAYRRSGGIVVFLDVSPEQAARRVGHGRGRPLLGENPMERWLAILAERRSVYEEVSTLRVLTDAVTPGQGARRLERTLERLVASRPHPEKENEARRDDS